MSTMVTAADYSEIRWRGHWIWVPEDKIELSMTLPGMDRPALSESHGLFRKTVQLQELPARAPARITADSRYALYVNDQEVFRGPVRSQPRRMHYDLFDVAPYLRLGENTFAVYVKYYGRPLSMYMPATANSGLGLTGALVFEANLGKAGWLVSDDSWKALKSSAWQNEGSDSADMVGGGVPVEVLDARSLPPGWRSAGYDDSQWGSAQKLRAIHIGGYAHSQPPVDPYGPLYPRPIGPLGGEVVAPATIRLETLQGSLDPSIQHPAKRAIAAAAFAVSTAQEIAALPIELAAPQGALTRISFDFGRIVSGLVRLDVQASAGTIFDLCYQEDPLTASQASMIAQHSGSRYIARGQDDRFEVFDSNGLRYIYLLVHGASGPLTVTLVAVRELIYPWQPGADFECSDADLNRLYQAGIRTVNLNSHDAFLDCPTREQRAWVGDSVVHQMVHLATNQDWRLAWHYLTLGNSPRSDGILPMSVSGEIEASGGLTIPDWSLHWVHGAYNFYRFNGDPEQVKAFMPTIERILRWYAPFQTAAGTLKDVTEWNLVDWASLFIEDTSSILTAIWARGLREFAEMAGWLEENASRRWAEGLYARAKAGYEIFWDETRATYVDIVKDGQQQKPASQVAGALSIVSGLAPRERWERIIQTITDPETLVVRSWTGGENGEYNMEKIMKQMMGQYDADWDTEKQIVIGEPFISYLVHDAVAQAGQANRLPALFRRWNQFLTGGYDTIGECWGWGTHVHGWSCTPTRDLVFYTLGVTPAEPGYRSAHIAPRLGGLAWAKGSVPTPFGLIKVHASANQTVIDSPIPVTLELEGKTPLALPAGRHTIG